MQPVHPVQPSGPSQGESVAWKPGQQPPVLPSGLSQGESVAWRPGQQPPVQPSGPSQGESVAWRPGQQPPKQPQSTVVELKPIYNVVPQGDFVRWNPNKPIPEIKPQPGNNNVQPGEYVTWKPEKKPYVRPVEKSEKSPAF